VARGDPQAEIRAPEEVGRDGELAGDHQPRREHGRLLGGLELTGARQLRPAARPLQPPAEGPRGLVGRAPRREPGRAEGCHEPVDLVDLRVGETERGGHHEPSAAWASIASDARRYSPASQSLARCR
jgi:hypothetical protein